MLGGGILHLAGVRVLLVGNDHVLEPVDHEQIPAVIQVARVADVNPAAGAAPPPSRRAYSVADYDAADDALARLAAEVAGGRRRLPADFDVAATRTVHRLRPADLWRPSDVLISAVDMRECAFWQFGTNGKSDGWPCYFCRSAQR